MSTTLSSNLHPNHHKNSVTKTKTEEKKIVIMIIIKTNPQVGSNTNKYNNIVGLKSFSMYNGSLVQSKCIYSLHTRVSVTHSDIKLHTI